MGRTMIRVRHDDYENRWTLEHNTATGKWRVVDKFWDMTDWHEFRTRRAAERYIKRRKRDAIEGARLNAAAEAVADKWEPVD